MDNNRVSFKDMKLSLKQRRLTSIGFGGLVSVGMMIPLVNLLVMPAAVVGDMCTCVGPPDSIVKGSATVMIGGKPAARMGDTTAHGGSIVLGAPTVMIGG